MIIQGCEQVGDLVLRADVVVVGSGAGGAVVAQELAEVGLEVVVLEEGPHIDAKDYGRFRPSEALRRMARLAGSQVAVGIGDSPTVSLLSGRLVGGSSTMTGGVCFRIPPKVLDVWEKGQGIKGYSERDLEPAYEAVEREIGVREVPESLRSPGTRLFVEGAQKRGLTIKPLRRNAPACVGAARCNFGCPTQAKLSVDITYLKKASERGTRIYSDCLVEEILTDGGRARGVTGRLLNGREGTPGSRLEVHADTVVLCAGTLHTPKILARSRVGLRSKQLGRHLTLHPGYRVGAIFDQRIEGWRGALQSVYSDSLEDRGLTFNGIWVPPNLLAAALPGVGKEHADYLRRYPNIALFGAMVHDDGGGRLFNIPGREPLITYRLARRDKERMVEGMRVLAECFFAAGAREVLMPIFGLAPLKSPDELKRVQADIPARLFETVAFHPLGSARLGTDASRAVVAPSGETFDLPGLFVADGSLFPTSIGVNSQLPIMAVATKIAWGLRERLSAGRPASRTAHPSLGVASLGA